MASEKPQLKALKRESIQRAYEKAERYRLLNEPLASESICLDILAIEPEHAPALVCLLLALTDQFGVAGTRTLERARTLLPRLPGAYEQVYYAGIICERFAKQKLGEHHPGARTLAYGYLEEALELYTRAEGLAPTGNDDAVLRFNACVRLIELYGLTAPSETAREPEYD
jgi:hypothetical protein